MRTLNPCYIRVPFVKSMRTDKRLSPFCYGKRPSTRGIEWVSTSFSTVGSRIFESNFPEVERLYDTTTRTAIEKLSAIFARFGIPMEVCSDNGPQFASYEFHNFAAQYDFSHITSSPHFPRSNGLAEKGVQIVKRILKKTREAGGDFWMGLLSYRSTPLEDGRSPAELLQGRQLRTTLPEFKDAPGAQVKKHHQLEDEGRLLPALREGQVVRLRDKSWSKKAVVQRLAAPRSYNVVTEDGSHLRRNRQHLLTTGESFQPGSSESDDSSDEDQGNEPVPQTPLQRHRESPSTVPRSPTVHSRRSGRQTQPPSRLGYDRNFEQVP